MTVADTRAALYRIDFVLERVAAGLDLDDAPLYTPELALGPCPPGAGDDRLESERLWPGRVKFLPGKDGMWIVDRHWAVCCTYPKWVAIDLHARENATIERASVGEPADTLIEKITELIGAPPAG
jgi:hypothetical protein